MIKGLSDRRRLPRLGKIKLGITVQASSGKTFPKAVDYFVCPPSVRAAYGDKPRELPIQFPVDDVAALFPQSYKMYTKSGLYCAGDGEVARRWQEGHLVERTCPCEYLDSGECGPVATLNFLLPDVPGVGVWQITTGSKLSIVSLNSSLETMARAFGGLVGIPFTLKLTAEQTQRFDDHSKQMVKHIVHTLSVDSQATFRQIWEWRKGIGAQVAALMPSAEPEVPRAIDAEVVSHPELDFPPEPPSPASDAQVEAVWSLFLDAAGQDATKALNLFRLTAKKNLNRVVQSLRELTADELTALHHIMRGD